MKIADAQQWWVPRPGWLNTASYGLPPRPAWEALQQALQLARDGHCEFPAVQGDIADALGLSVVHIHRVLRGLRDDGLATLRNGMLQIDDWDKLAALGSFDAERLRPQQDPAEQATVTTARRHAIGPDEA